MGLNPREKSERVFDGSKQVIPGNGVKTVKKKKNPFEDIIKDVNDQPGPVPSPPPTPDPTSTPAPTPSITPTQSVTPTITPTSSITPTITPTNSVTPSITPTKTATPTPTRSPRPTPSPTKTPPPTPSITPTKSVTPTPTITPTSSPNCFCTAFINTSAGTTQKLNIKNCYDVVQLVSIPLNDAAARCIRPGQYTGITSEFSVTTLGVCDTPNANCTFSVSPTPTPSITKTPVYTVTPTSTPTTTPTVTPTTTVTPTVTKTPTTTPTTTPTVTPTTTVTPTVTTSVTPTVTVTPSRVSLIGPYLKFANKPGGTVNLIFKSSTGATFDIRWGDGTFVNAVPNSAVDSNFTYSKTYGGTIFTGSADNFRTSNVASVNKIKEITLDGVSQIEYNQYTFSAFTASSLIKVSNSTIPSFNYTLPAAIITLSLQGITGGTNLTFDPIFTNRGAFRNFYLQSTNIQTFNYSLTGGSSSQVFNFSSNPNLKSITTSIGGFLGTLTISNNSVLSALTISNGLTASTILSTLTVSDNPLLNGWSYNLPASLTSAVLTQNAFTSFDINLNPNTNLQSLQLFGNQSITSFTNTVSACTSLTVLRLDINKIKLLPPVFPNSIRNLFFPDNQITGYTSNIPLNLRILDGSAELSNANVFSTWNVDLTGATSLQSFYLNKVKLTSWTKKFPVSIRTVEFRSNSLPNFDINLVSGATTLDLSNNPTLGRLFNLSLNNTITTLKLGGTNILAPDPYIVYSTAPNTGQFPVSLQSIYLNATPITNWNKTFSAATGLNYITFYGTPLNQSSVDFILYDIRYNSSVNYGQLILSGPSGPATPSAAGLINKSYLQSTRGWQVITN